MRVRIGVLPALLCAFVSVASAADAPRTIWDGVFSAAQAARGEAAYSMHCARCHRDDLGGYGGVLTGAKFMDKWREDNLHNFYHLVKTTMPRNNPDTLSEAVYADIVAYVLQANDFPAGKTDLKPDAMQAIRVQGKEGPAPVPDFALVQVAGCLSQTADGGWTVLGATEPIRTREPGASPDEELKTWNTKAPGPHTFKLIDATYVNSHPPKDHKVLVKGLLIRQPGNDRLNTTDLQDLGAACKR